MVEIYDFLGFGRLEISGHFLPSHLCWFYWHDGSYSFLMKDESERKEEYNYPVSGPVEWRWTGLLSANPNPCPLPHSRTWMSTEAADSIFLSLLRQESSVLFLKHWHCVFCNLYNHLLLISSQSCKLSLQFHQSDHHPYQTVLVLGFPAERCHLGSLASSGHSQIHPHLSSSPSVNNHQVRFLDSKEILGSIPAFL